MASTIKISDTLNWVSAFIVQRPTTGVNGVANEPGLTSANLVMNTILGPPFAWVWNRATTTFTTVAGTSDYSVAISDYGWLERATVFNNTLSPTTYELEIKNSMTVDTTQERPAFISPFKDDNAGNITFRLLPVPDLVYTVTLTYQKAPVLATTLGSTTWAPIPDKYAFVYERGLRAEMHGMYNTQLYLSEAQLFWRQLVGVAEGLSESQKAIFLEDRLRSLRTQTAELQTLPESPKRR